MPSLISRLATAEANINIQLALLVLHAMLWHVITTRAATRIAPWCQAQPWIERFRARAGSTLRRGYGITFADEDDMFALVTLVAAILCVHLTGGLLCVPALLARRPTPLVVACVEIKFRRLDVVPVPATDRWRGGSQSAPHRSWRWRRTVHW